MNFLFSGKSISCLSHFKHWVLLIASTLLVACFENSSAPPPLPFIPMAVYLADTERCRSVPQRRTHAQAAFFRLPENQSISISVSQRNDEGEIESDPRVFGRGILYMGGWDSNGGIKSDVWFYDLAHSKRVADPGVGDCPWVRFDVPGPGRAEGSLVFDFELGRFHLIGGVEYTPNGGTRTADTVLVMDATRTPFTSWSDPAQWVAGRGAGPISDQVHAYGADICTLPRSITCTEISTNYEIWSHGVDACRIDNQGLVEECNQEPIEFGYFHDACELDPVCMSKVEPAVCANDETCGRLDETPSEFAAWTWDYEGYGRSRAATAYNPETGVVTIAGGVAGCEGPDCRGTENYPDLLPGVESLTNRSTDRVDTWDTRTRLGIASSSGIAAAPDLRISAAGSDWLGFDWSASVGKWQRTSTPFMAILGGGVQEEMAFRWNHVPDSVLHSYSNSFYWEYLYGTSEFVKDPASVGPPNRLNLTNRLLTFDGSRVSAIRGLRMGELISPGVARINAGELLAVGGEVSGNATSTVRRITIRRASGPIEQFQGRSPLTTGSGELRVSGAQLVVDPIERFAYVLGGSHSSSETNIIDYDLSLRQEPHTFEPVNDVLVNQCDVSGPTKKGFVVDTRTRLHESGQVDYEASMEADLNCVSAPECYIDAIRVSLGDEHVRAPENLELDLEVFVPNATGALPNRATYSEIGLPVAAAEAGPRGDPILVVPAPEQEPWPNRSRLEITVRYSHSRINLPFPASAAQVGATGIRALDSSEDCTDLSDMPDLCAFYLRSVPMFIDEDTTSTDNAGNEVTVATRTNPVEVHGTIEVPRSWGVAAPGTLGPITQITASGEDLDQHTFTLTLPPNSTDQRRPPTIIVNRWMEEKVSFPAQSQLPCAPPVRVYGLSTAPLNGSDLGAYLSDNNGASTSVIEKNYNRIVGFLGPLPVDTSRIFYLPDPNSIVVGGASGNSYVAGFNARRRIEIHTIDLDGTFTDSTRGSTVHELTHHWFGTSPNNDVPSWLEEGLSQIMENNIQPAPGKAAERFGAVLSANVSGSGCNLNVDYTTSTADSIVLNYKVSPYTLTMFYNLARAHGSLTGDASFWNFWQSVLTGTHSTEDIKARMDGLVPGFSSAYIPNQNCPGVPILALRKFEFLPKGDVRTEQAWLNGKGYYVIDQVQDTQYGMPIFPEVPYALACLSSSVAGQTHVSGQRIPAFHECSAAHTNIRLNELSLYVPSTSRTRVYKTFGMKLLQSASGQVALNVDPAALTGTGNLVAPVPTDVRLFQSAGLEILPYASLSSHNVWCSNDQSANCLVDLDRDQSPSPTDCRDIGIVNWPRPSLIFPSQVQSSGSEFDDDCNCIGKLQPQQPPDNLHGWNLPNGSGTGYEHCDENF